MDATAITGLVPSIRASLEAKIERLLQRPLIARVATARPAPRPVPVDDGVFDLFDELDDTIRAFAPARAGGRERSPWRTDPSDGTCTVRIAIDYDDLWRGREREVRETVAGTVDQFVALLTDQQRALLERSPREFLELHPRPERVELVRFRTELVSTSERVVELTLACPPASRAHARHLAVVPNLVPLERQLEALDVLERGTGHRALAPLRVLVGLEDGAALHEAEPARDFDRADITERLDESQLACVEKAGTTPHFACIHGPPGSGKTTVILSIVLDAVARGERVLVVSPTHVAVDNVVEKLVSHRDPDGRDTLEPLSLPVRYAARPKKLLDAARPYWIGPKDEERAATVSERLQDRLCELSPLARRLYAQIDPEESSLGPLSQAVVAAQSVICGTPIGILSHRPVGSAAPGSYDLLVVDEVSKMTLPEFLAVAVKAERWVLVGDPEQLPPYNDAEDNAVTLDDLLPPTLEIVCSTAAVLEQAKPSVRLRRRLAVVTTQPERAAGALRAHLRWTGLRNPPSIGIWPEVEHPGVVLCQPYQLDEVCAFLEPARQLDRGHNPHQRGSVDILVERGVAVPRPELASGRRLIEPRRRAAARIFDTAFNVYHAQPWARRAGQRLSVVGMRKGLNKFMPSPGALVALAGDAPLEAVVASHAALIHAIAQRYAINAVSVYDWIAGIPVQDFDMEPLSELAAVTEPLAELRAAVEPFVGVLRRQYRMLPSLSQVPRELFYFGEALEDGAQRPNAGCRIGLMQVDGDGGYGETNQAEAEAICQVLRRIDHAAARGQEPPQRILVITPYRAQERLIAEAVNKAQLEQGLQHVEVEVCTLDRCQGREAEFVFISLVRSRATAFLDAPKRWNVALTRARSGLFIFGDVDAYLREAGNARREALRTQHRGGRPRMSLLARILEAYNRQIGGFAATRPRRAS